MSVSDAVFVMGKSGIARPTASTTPRHPGNHPPSAGHPSSKNAISATNNQDEPPVAAKIHLPIVEPTDEDSVIGEPHNRSTHYADCLVSRC